MFDLNRLRTDQLVRLKQVGGDLNQLTDEELTELKESQEEVGDFGAGLMAAESALRTAVAGAAQSFGLESLSQTELTKAKQVEEELGLRYQRDVPSIIEEFEEEGVLGGIAALPEYLKETLAFSLPPTGTALAAGAAGTLLAGPGVGLAAAVTLGTPIFAGNNLKRQMEENDIGLEDTNVMKAFAVGSGQAAFDAVIGRALGFMGPKLPNLNTAAGRQFALANPEKANRALQENIRRVGKAAEQGFTNRFLRKGLQGAGIEAVTETSQQYAEIVQADPDRLFDLTPDQRRELYESAIAGGLLGGTITGTTGAVFKPTKARLEAKQKQLAEFQRLDLDRHLQDETQESIEMERNAELLTGVPKVTPMAEAVNRAFPTDTDVPDPAVVVPEVTRVLQVAGLVTPETHSSIFPNNPAPEFLDIQPKEKPPSISSLDLVINPLTDPEIEQAINELQPQRTPLDTKGLGTEQKKLSRSGYQVFRRKDPTNTFNVYTVTDGFNSIEFTRDPDQSVGKYNALVINPSKKVSNNPFIGKQRNLGTDNLQQSVDKIIEDWSVGDFVQPRKRPATVAKKKAAMQKIRKKLKEDYGLTDAEAQVILEASPETLKAAQKYSRKRGQTQGQLIRETVKKYASPEKRLQFDAKSTRVRQILADRLKAVGLGDVALRFEQKITPEEDPNIKDIQEGVIEGVTENQGGAVSIALANALYDPNISEAQLTQKLGEVMNHEMIHAIKQLGLITDQEYKILVNAAKQQKFVDRQGVTRSFTYFDRAQRLYPMNDPPKDISETDLEALQQKSRNIQEEEAVAELFRDWAAGRKKMTGKPRNLFQRIADFFRGLGKDIREDPKAENIFKAIESGEIGGRERISPMGEFAGEADANPEALMYSAKRVFPKQSAVPFNVEQALESNNFPESIIMPKLLGVGKSNTDEDIKEGTLVGIRLNLNGRSFFGPSRDRYQALVKKEIAKINRQKDLNDGEKDRLRNMAYRLLDKSFALPKEGDTDIESTFTSQVDQEVEPNIPRDGTTSFAIQTAHKNGRPDRSPVAYDVHFTVENGEFVVLENGRAQIQAGLVNKHPMAAVAGNVVHDVKFDPEKGIEGVVAKFNPFDPTVHTFYIELDGEKYPVKGFGRATVYGDKVYITDPVFHTPETMPVRNTNPSIPTAQRNLLPDKLNPDGVNKGDKNVTRKLPEDPKTYKFFSLRSSKPLETDVAVNLDDDVIELPPNIFGTTKLDKEPPAVDQRLSVKPRIFSTGRIVGAPAGYDTESDRTELVNRMVELMEDPFAVIEKSKGWYERSGKEIREITRGDPELMEKVTRLMALYSQANSVGANTTATVKSMYQFATGADTAFAGRFPSTTAARIPDLLAAPSFDQTVVGVSDKLENFYRNLIDAATEQDTYADASTQDRWMMRLFGYKVAEDEDVGGASALGAPQYLYAKDIVNRVADAYADKTGERLLPRQVQAVLWTYIKNSTDFEKLKTDAKREAFEPKVVDFGDYLTRATVNITWESRPSTSLPILSWIHDSRQAQEEFNEAVRTNIFTNPDGTDVIFDMLGASQLYNSDTSIGAYEGKVAPNVVSRLVLQREDGSYLDDIATKAASIIGYITKQDAVPWYRPDITGGKLDAIGHKVTFDRDLTPDMEDRLLAHLDKQMPGIGFTKVGTSLQFINFRNTDPTSEKYKVGEPTFMKDREFVNQKTGEGRLIDGLRSFDEDMTFEVESFRAQSEYISNDWETQPNGEGYIQRYGEGGFGDLQPRIDALAQEYLALANEFEGRREEFAGRPPTTRRFSRRGSDNVQRSGADRGVVDPSIRGGSRADREDPRLAYPVYESGRQGPEEGRSEYFGVHYTQKNALESLDGEFHGTGRAGLELKRGRRDRIYFYIQDSLDLPQAEIQLSRMPHGYGATLSNIYDPRKSPYIVKDVKNRNNGIFNADMFEDMVVSEGYDGYINHQFQPTEAVVLLGKNNVPVVQVLRERNRVTAEEISEERPKQTGDTRRLSRKFSARQREPQRVAQPVDVDEIANRFLGAEEETNPLARFWDQNILGRVEGETRWQAFTRNAVNRFLPGYLLDDYVNGEITNPAESVGRNMELAQNMTGRLQAMLELGPLAFNKDTGTVEQIADPKLKGLRDIFAPIGTQLKRPFQTYAIAKRELRLRQEGRVGFSGITEQQAQDTVDQLIDKYPQFEQVHADYQAFNEQMINFAKDSGLLTEEQADSFRNMDYVPFYRLIESATQETNFQQTMSARARAALKDPNVFEKELEGGIDKIGDLYEVVTKNAKFIVSAGLRNYAMDKTGRALELAEQKGGLKSWGRLAKKGETGNIMTLQRDGEEVSYKINDPALWTAVAGLTEIQKQSWIRWLETLGGILRSGVTLMPGFQLANLWRGKVDAYIKTGVPLYRLDQTAAAMRDVYKNDEDVQRFKLISGMGGYLYGGTAESVSKTLERDYRLKEGSGSFFRKVGDQFGRAVVALEKTGEASEMAERLVIQRRLMEQGVNEKEAVFQGLNLINFGRRGAGGSPVMSALVNVLIPSVPFLNARIQGLYRLIEDPNAPGEVKTTAFKEMAGRGMLITAGSVTLAGLAMQDEERWDNETVIEKVTNDIFYVGDTKIRIPKAFEVGALFGTIPVMTIDAIRQETGEDFAQALRHIFLSTFAFNPVPQGVLPILEVVGNYDAFRGAPIEGLSLQRLPDELRAYETTPEIYKFLSQAGLGQFVGLSPLELQQLFEGYTGTMGSSLIAVTDTLASETGVIPERPSGIFGNAFATAAGQITGLNRFLRQDGEGASRFVRDFYELRRDVEQTSAALKQAQGAGLIEEVNDLMEERGKSLGLRTQFNRVARALGKINKQIDAVRISPDLSADQKRDRLNELRKEKIRISAQVVRMAKSSGYFD